MKISLRNLLQRISVSFASALTVVGMTCVILPAVPVNAASPNWAVVSAPTGVRALEGVACLSSTDCLAIGWNDTGTVIEQWDGLSWSISPTQFAGQLSSISCFSSTYCMAVGFASYSGAAGVTLTEQFSGGVWSVVPSPGSVSGILTGVSCVSDTNCVAVGAQWIGASTSPSTLTEIWNGSTWSLVGGPTLGSGSQLRGISCTSANNCMAVGDEGTATLVEQWNGSSWSVVSTSGLVVAGALNGISCVSGSDCVAVGSEGFSVGQSNGVGGVFQWNGATWSVVAQFEGTLVGSTGSSTSLNAVSCSSANSCIVVGSSQYDSGSPGPGEVVTIGQWNGSSWSQVSSPSLPNPNLLSGVSCASSGFCVGVGWNFGNSLIEAGGVTGGEWGG